MILRTNWKIVFSHNSLLTSLNGTRIFRKIAFFLGISRNLAKFCESWVFCEKHINYTLFFQILSAIFLCFWNKIVRKCAILEKILKILKIFEICPKNTAFFKKGAKIQLPTMKNSVSTSVRTRSGRYPLFPSGSERVIVIHFIHLYSNTLYTSLTLSLSVTRIPGDDFFLKYLQNKDDFCVLIFFCRQNMCKRLTPQGFWNLYTRV